jgi:hypothetical protein
MRKIKKEIEKEINKKEREVPEKHVIPFELQVLHNDFEPCLQACFRATRVLCGIRSKRRVLPFLEP